MVTFKQVAEKIKSKISSAKSFKIGKTGQTVKERFDQEHYKTYKFYESLGTSSDPKIIDDLELYLIKEFKEYKGNNNEQNGGGEMKVSTTGTYSIYLCWN